MCTLHLHKIICLVMQIKQMIVYSNLSKMKTVYKESTEIVLESSAAHHMPCLGLRALKCCQPQVNMQHCPHKLFIFLDLSPATYPGLIYTQPEIYLTRVNLESWPSLSTVDLW